MESVKNYTKIRFDTIASKLGRIAEPILLCFCKKETNRKNYAYLLNSVDTGITSGIQNDMNCLNKNQM